MKDSKNVFDGAYYIKADAEAPEYSFYDPIPFFRKEIEVNKAPKKAVIHVQSPGFACFFINGIRITEDIFISPTSDYTRILWYNSYDVTSLLEEGKNVISVIAGNGYLNESFRTPWDYDKAYWRDAPQFILSLDIDGERVAVSDRGWKVSKDASHIIYSHIRSGEHVDMRRYSDAWKYRGYDDSDWQDVCVNEKGFSGEFRYCDCPPVREIETIYPVSVQKKEKGILFDFGVNHSGYAEFVIKADEGSEIYFRYAEEVFEDGAPRHCGMDTPYYYPDSPFQTNKLIASGGTDRFKPMFSYHGYRYVLVEGLPENGKIISASSFFIHNDIRRKADFECGNDVLNYIYRAGMRSSESNFFWCVTDCPTREKLGWTNDSQASAEQMLINFDILPLYCKWFEDIKADMKDDGSLHGTIPSHDWGLDWGPVCDTFLYELPYRIYLYTGESEMLVRAIPYFERYISFLEKSISENKEFILGDWLGCGSSELIPKEFVRDFYLVKALRITSLAYRLAKSDETDIVEGRYLEAKKDFTDRYIDENGRCRVNEQTAIAMMLVDGLYTDRHTLCDQLVRAVLRDRTRLVSGMVGIQYLYDALSICDRPDLAFDMMAKNDPGYATWYKKGATTLWERWIGDYGDESHNHHMFSCVIAWFFKSLLGIMPSEDAPGFERIGLCPMFISELEYAKGHIDTVRGRIDASWEKVDGGFVYKVTVPEGVSASFDGRSFSGESAEFFVRA